MVTGDDALADPGDRNVEPAASPEPAGVQDLEPAELRGKATWGSRHNGEYAWGQVSGFDDTPDAFLERGGALEILPTRDDHGIPVLDLPAPS